LTIGKGNNILENLTRELQAAAEAYSASYYETKVNATLAILSLERAKEELQQFNDGHKEYELDLQLQRQRRIGITDKMRAIAEAEVQDIALERVGMQDAIDEAKVDVDKNCKGTGQPLHAEIDCILQSHGIDRAAQFGGALAGKGCQKLMAEADAIINEIIQLAFQLPICLGSVRSFQRRDIS
jgi:hypothetical protein